jgi:hypothetical protein
LRAWSQLADIFLLQAKSFEDLSMFKGWTTAELRQYSDTGELPERIAWMLEAGKAIEKNQR